ncbi:unnamed protein product, partial [marine sediment metagenome]
FGQIFPHVVIGSPVRLILLYPGEPVELPKVFEEQSPDISHATD